MPERNEREAVSSPRLILAHSHQDFQSLLARTFRRLHWDVHLAPSGPEARRLASLLEADVVILQAELPEESGWLTCDKLTREQPLTRVVLVSDDVRSRNQQLASFVGASVLVRQDEGLPQLIEELLGSTVPASN